MKSLSLIKCFKYQKTVYVNCLLAIILMVMSCGSQEKLIENNVLKIDNPPKDLESFEKLMWIRNADGIIVINKKNLNKIHRSTQTGEDEYFSFLQSYAIRLTASSKQPIAKKFSFSENAYVAGYAVEYLYKCQKRIKNGDLFKDTKFINRFLAPWNANKYNREFKKHDYYGLKLLKKHHLEHFWEYPEQDTVPSIKRIIE